MFDASVKWELTVWPLMDMANVAVTTPYTGPRRGALEPNVANFCARFPNFPAGKRHRFVIYMTSANFLPQGINF